MPLDIAVIGGNTGIGLATVGQLARAGHRVHLAARNPGEASSHAASVRPFDAASPAGLVWPERLDGLAYFPGTIALKPFHRMTDDDFRRDLQVNFFGAVEALRSALPALKASGSASVVLFSTVAVVQGMPMHAGIAAAKGALEGLARSLAAEWAPAVRVNVVAPGLTDTPLAAPLLNAEAKREAAAKRHPLQRVGTAEQTAALAAWLLGPESVFMTGQVLRPDGGLSAVRTFA
jgi:NAD(P)-dependent dehydrogenase (short-subunit alcohol dehydrogenase family)